MQVGERVSKQSKFTTLLYLLIVGEVNHIVKTVHAAVTQTKATHVQSSVGGTAVRGGDQQLNKRFQIIQFVTIRLP